jgi:hypothetical protein
MVAVPVREAPLLGSIVSSTVPLPLPLAPDVTLIHGALPAAAAVQAQPPGEVTLTLSGPPPAAGDADSGAMAKVHPSACDTVNVRPAIVKVPERAAPAFAAALKRTAALPVPLAPEVIESHDTLLVAVQPHPLPEVTFTVPVAPPAGTDCVAGAIEYEQPLPCWTVNVWPPAVTAALRDGPELSATVKRTCPSPVPSAGGVTVIHGTDDAAVHAQPAAVCTVKEPGPPLSPMVALVGDST